MAPLTGVEVAKHNKSDDCWVIVHVRWHYFSFLPNRHLTNDNTHSRDGRMMSRNSYLVRLFQ